ncbi:MAG: hypothetical protein HY096_02085 [Nitrospinae bacterium]|nr:hypothetical protein [Nitrospinota bacterium]MBI3815173.1 hypothetical protein [Nitrospinota bacterium]
MNKQEHGPLLSSIAKWIWPQVQDFLSLLEWILQVAEYILVFLMVSIIFYGGCHIMFTSDKEDIKTALTVINNHWKAFVIILVPLFYRTVRVFLEEVQEFHGMKRRNKKQDTEEIQPEDNPRPEKK